MQRRGTSPASNPKVIAPLTPNAAVEITLSSRRWLAKGGSLRGRLGQQMLRPEKRSSAGERTPRGLWSRADRLGLAALPALLLRGKRRARGEAGALTGKDGGWGERRGKLEIQVATRGSQGFK
jgi:hypothetical protein